MKKIVLSVLLVCAVTVLGVVTGPVTLQRLNAKRWLVTVPAGHKAQAAVFEGQNGSGGNSTDYDWFNLPAENVPNVPHMFFRAVPVGSDAAKKAKPVPQWFLDADKATR